MKSPTSPKRLLITLLFTLAIAGAVAWSVGLFSGGGRPPQNSILVIAPYRYEGTWVFDDDRFGLVREPFVGGVPEMIDHLVADIPNADEGFRLTFSAQPFPDYEKKLTWVRGDSVGNYYKLDEPPMEGWICPALFKYYETPPAALYVKADAVAEPSREEKHKEDQATKGESTPEEVYRAFMLAGLRGEEAEIRKLIVDDPDADVLWEGPYPAEVAAALAEVYESMEITRVDDADGDEARVVTLESEAVPIQLRVVREGNAWRLDAAPLIKLRKAFSKESTSSSKLNDQLDKRSRRRLF